MEHVYCVPLRFVRYLPGRELPFGCELCEDFRIGFVGCCEGTEASYVRLLPPGEVIAEKVFEMGIGVVELARRCELPPETIQKLLQAELPLTETIADKIEKVTWMNAEGMMRLETRYRNDLMFVQQHPEYPVV